MLTKNEYAVLKTCEGIINLFKQSSETIWQGFDLSQRPFIIYIPGKWALLLNRSQPVDGFTQYPKDWPDLGCPVLYHQGQYKDLIGQLAFDFTVDTFKTVAISFPEENLDSIPHWQVLLFGGYVHEAFHQFQSEVFGETSWEREEFYPILDRENTALAYLEVRLLVDALEMMKADDSMECRKYVEQFVAIRTYRWHHSDPFVARYEQGQEIHEGTPRYVEMKSIKLMKTLKFHSTLAGFTSSMEQDFDFVSFPEMLITDFRERMAENSIKPEDMLRNRIYPVGSAMGFLLDYFHIDWKSKAQQAGSDFSFAQLFVDGLGLQKDQFEELVDRAKATYGYEHILSSTKTIIQEYLDAYEKELALFESQPGYRLQIEFTTKSLSRSRTSLAKQWLVDMGTRSLCSRYQVFTMKTDKMVLQIQNSGVWQRNEWDTKHYTVVFFVEQIESISLDGKPYDMVGDSQQSFEKIEMSGTSFKFNFLHSGTITSRTNQLVIHMNQ